jgi:hypothetical protein
MNPWYEQAKTRGRYFVSELVADLYRAADHELATVAAPSAPGASFGARPARVSGPTARAASSSLAERDNGEPDHPAHTRSHA